MNPAGGWYWTTMPCEPEMGVTRHAYRLPAPS
jgi:hypothetical protein